MLGGDVQEDVVEWFMRLSKAFFVDMSNPPRPRARARARVCVCVYVRVCGGGDFFLTASNTFNCQLLSLGFTYT